MPPEMLFVERYGLVVAHSLSRSIDSKTIVQVMNLPNPPAPVTVYKDEKFGLLWPLADVCADVCAVVNGKNLECNQKDTKAKTEAMEKAIQQLLSDVQDVVQQEKHQLKPLLEEFQDVISVGDDDLGCMELVHHKIDTRDAQPVQ